MPPVFSIFLIQSLKKVFLSSWDILTMMMNTHIILYA